MFKRWIAVGAMVGIVGLAVGVVASAARADTQTAAVGDAGTVTFSVEGGVIAFVGADAAAGWDFTVDREDGRHLKVTFRNAGGGELEFEAEIEDGGVVVAGASGSTSPSAASSTTLGSTSSTTLGSTSSSSSTTPTSSPESTSTTASGGATSTTAADDDDDDDDDDDASAVPQALTFLAGEAGTVDVIVIGDEIVFGGASTESGWSFEVDHAGRSHVDVDFLHEDGRVLEFRVDADLRVRIEIDN